MSKFNGVMIASDLDGTLLGKDHKISSENIKAIEYFQKNGGIFTVATGRPPISIENLLENIKITVPLILLNGSVIYDFENKKPISTKMLTGDALSVVKNVLENFSDIGCEIFDVDDIHLVNFSEVSKAHFEKIHKETNVIKLEDAPTSDKWLKVNFTHHDREKLAKLEDFINKNYENSFQLCYSCREFLEITNKQARKDVGVFEVSDKLSISREHIYTIGDNFNDFYMLKNATKGFAPENAEQEVKDVAFKVLGDHDNSAVAQMIEYLDTIY